MAALRYIAIALTAALLIALFVWQMIPDEVPEGHTRVEIAGETFFLEIAATDEAIQRGLMDREEIDEDGGMIFVFPRLSEHSFWMKNCLVDIDLLYLDEARRVVQVVHMQHQPPQRDDETEFAYEERIRADAMYPSDGPVAFAVELKAGTIERLGISPGDRLEFDQRALKALVPLR